MEHYHPGLMVETISAGKFRRYHTMSIWQQLANFRTIGLPNLIDIVKIAVGTVQSLYKLLRWRPDVVFTKGGYVCLPVGAAAHVLGIPLAIHESDAHTGLANRVLSRWADVIATGTPVKNYRFPKAKTHYIGIPIAANITPLSAEKRSAAKKALGFSSSKPLVVITGGGLGAKRINDTVVAVIDDLVELANVLLVSGEGQYSELKEKTQHVDSSRFQLKPYVEGLVDVLATADVVVSRAGATTLLELAALAKPTILIPNARLTGGHQLKNAKVYEENHAVVSLDEDRLVAAPRELVDALNVLLINKTEQDRLSKAMYQFAKPYAAKDMAHLILSIATRKR